MFATQNATVHHCVVDLSPMKVVVSLHALKTFNGYLANAWGKSRQSNGVQQYCGCPEVLSWPRSVIVALWATYSALVITALKARGKAHRMYIRVCEVSSYIVEVYP